MCVLIQEELQLSRNSHSRASVISDLLLRISRSLEKNPTWWDILERVLIGLDTDLYQAMSQYPF